MSNDPEKQQGLNMDKWTVVNGANPYKHRDCKFFVLDLTHDKFSIPALRVYAMACREEYPQLADDILKMIEEVSK